MPFSMLLLALISPYALICFSMGPDAAADFASSIDCALMMLIFIILISLPSMRL